MRLPSCLWWAIFYGQSAPRRAVFLTQKGAMSNPYVLSSKDILGLVLLVAIFGLGPAILMWCLSRRPKPRLKECPHCSAQNRFAQTRCYCCGREFSPPVSVVAIAPVIERVRQADGEKAKQTVKADTTPAHTGG